RTSWILVPLAQALVGVPFVVRTMLPVLRAVDGREAPGLPEPGALRPVCALPEPAGAETPH
ncbi:hypothetical protein AB0K46_09040, partial [Streptomyces cinnamoneus]